MATIKFCFLALSFGVLFHFICVCIVSLENTFHIHLNETFEFFSEIVLMLFIIWENIFLGGMQKKKLQTDALCREYLLMNANYVLLGEHPGEEVCLAEVFYSLNELFESCQVHLAKLVLIHGN
jgi:hypothetical protein